MQASVDNTYHIGIGPALNAKIPYQSNYWNEFNGSFTNKELPQLDIASELYEGHAITVCCDPQWRKGINYQLGQHLGLDFDTEDKRSTIPELMKDSFIKKYASIIHTTISHTPDKPRARVIFLLDQPIHQANNYALAATSLLWIYGTADVKCKDAVRFFYGGKPGATEMEWLNNELPLELVKDLIKRYQSTGNITRQQTQHNYTPGTTDEHKIADALKHINPWSLDYDEWVMVLMAIHSELPGGNGLSLAISWGDGKPGEIEQKWKGFASNGNVSGKISIGTLFSFAKDRGWSWQ